jgi:Cu-Zn family superoxide dismutase
MTVRMVSLAMTLVLGLTARGWTAEAKARFQDAKNAPVGEAMLREAPNGVVLRVRFADLPPGVHGFHVHRTGKCEPPFTSAGDHFNPTGATHGFAAAKGPHAGDLPNIDVPESGDLTVELFVPGVTLASGKPGSLLDQDGSALVVHAGPDDHTTDPSGKSGDRIACAVVERPRE